LLLPHAEGTAWLRRRFTEQAAMGRAVWEMDSIVRRGLTLTEKRMRVLGFELPWWAWALITWGACLLATIVIAFAAPDDLWTVPVLDEKYLTALTDENTCNHCTLYKDKLFLTMRRSDQCEFPRLKKTVNCDIVKECGPDPTQCKPPLNFAQSSPLCGTATIVEPQNTWSNFAYLLAGILILFRRPSVMGTVVGIQFCLIALFSGLYHASLANIWQAFDVAWIYTLLLSLIAYGVEAMGIRYAKRAFHAVGMSIGIAFPVAIGILVAYLKATGNLPSSPLTDSTNVTIGLVGILGIPVIIIMLDFWWVRWGLWQVCGCTKTRAEFYAKCLEGRDFISGQQWKFQLWMFIPALVGGMLRTALGGLPGDGCGHSLCLPHSPFQAHAWWHILGAMSLWWTYNFLAQAATSNDTMVPVGPFA
jgi:hypothetical protein